MKYYTYLILGAYIAISCLSCTPRQLTKPYDELKVNYLYSLSVADAAKPQPWEIKKDLISIENETESSNLVWREINGEQYILVSSWKYDTTYYKNNPETGMYNTGKYPIWVTVAPELQEVCQSKKFGRKEGLDLRLKQLLGMPPTVEKNYFVEFWVHPNDLFRPCLDGDVVDVNCTLAFPEDVEQSYVDWINNLRLDSYYNPEWNKNYPWTQLGYTYDWHPKSKKHVGLSEFVIDADKDIIVNKVYTTEEYCKILND